MPRVSVLLAVHNGGTYLQEAVASVLAQTFEDFELLLVDDASTDDAVESLPPDARIRALRNERNLGQIPSLNRGLREAKGDYVARLDHDDICLPRRLERQVELLDEEPGVGLVGSWVDIVDTGGRVWARVRPRVDSYADFVAQVVTSRVHLVHPSIMFRRALVAGLGGFDERLGAAEDHDLYRRLVLARQRVGVVQERLLTYRRHEEQMTFAKAEIVFESDARSEERFLARLAPELSPRSLRLLLHADPRFWAESPSEGSELDGLLAAMGERLELDPAERSVVARALAHRGARALLTGWASGAPGYARRTRPLAGFAARHGGPEDRGLAALTPLLGATASAGRRFGEARRTVTRLLRSDRLAGARRIARGSRVLRSLYARVIDTRPHVD